MKSAILAALLAAVFGPATAADAPAGEFRLVVLGTVTPNADPNLSGTAQESQPGHGGIDAKYDELGCW